MSYIYFGVVLLGVMFLIQCIRLAYHMNSTMGSQVPLPTAIWLCAKTPKYKGSLSKRTRRTCVYIFNVITGKQLTGNKRIIDLLSSDSFDDAGLENLVMICERITTPLIVNHIARRTGSVVEFKAATLALVDDFKHRSPKTTQGQMIISRAYQVSRETTMDINEVIDECIDHVTNLDSDFIKEKIKGG